MRTAVFDPVDANVFNEQRQRFDWSLLQNGNVFRYNTRFQLDSACSHLGDGLGYLVHRLDAVGWTSVNDMYDAFASALSYRPSYGRGPDSFEDALSDVAAYTFGSDPSTTGTVLAIAGFDTVRLLDSRTATWTLDAFARQARLAGLYAHPMLCLVETTATDLGRVGGIAVYPGTVWDAEPDPPQPFHEADLVEHVLRIAGSYTDAVAYVEAVRSVVTGVLPDVGRWQILDPIVAPQYSRSSRRETPRVADHQVWEIAIGLRGDGDYRSLGDRLVNALHDEGLPPFEQLASRVYRAGDEASKAQTRYSKLSDRP